MDSNQGSVLPMAPDSNPSVSYGLPPWMLPKPAKQQQQGGGDNGIQSYLKMLNAQAKIAPTIPTSTASFVQPSAVNGAGEASAGDAAATDAAGGLSGSC